MTLDMRRHHLARIKAKRRRQWYDIAWHDPERQIGMLSHTGRLCSCLFCSRYGVQSTAHKRPAVLTVQERRLSA